MQKDSAVLVTGGAGFIGSHFCKLLSQHGILPVTLDNLASGHADAVRWGPLVAGDIADGELVRDAIQKFGVTAMVHFAGCINVGESVKDPAKYYGRNVADTIKLLDAVRDCGLDKIIFSSSAAVYGMSTKVPIDEDAPTAPVNPYGWSKLFVEKMLADYARAYAMKYVALRYFNAAGADIDGDLGERHDPETHLIPRAIMAAAGQVPCLDIYGEDYATPDGTCIRDYIHVTDLARGHLSALDHLRGGGDSCCINLGSGSGASVRQIVGMIEHVTKRTVPTRIVARRSGDPPVLLADVQTARRVIKFETVHSDLETIVGTAWRFYRTICS